MGFDWASENYLADALDAAEHRAERAESYLAEQQEGRANIVGTLAKTGTAMGTAGLLGYLSNTMWRDAKTGKPGMLGLGSGTSSIGVNFLGGLALKAAALFGNKLKLPEAAVPYIDAAGQGALDHWAVMFGMNAGAGAAAPAAPAATKGVYPRVGCGSQPAPAVHATAAVPAVGAANSPESYMTADQLRVWRSYAG